MDSTGSPSTSHCDKGKRKSETQGGTRKGQTPTKRQRDTGPEASRDEKIVSKVHEIIQNVKEKKLHKSKEGLHEVIRNKIDELKTEKRELVGVFGRTGAGKSSLINAIIGEKKCLPTGKGEACTSAIIKVESTSSSSYEAEIEFINKEEWLTELETFQHLLMTKDKDDETKNTDEDDSDDDDDDDDDDNDEQFEKDVVFRSKLNALYGDKWKNKTPEQLVKQHNCKKKILTVSSAQEISTEITKYTQNSGQEAERRYWPLVKYVTIKVPNNKLPQHVTLIDLPGIGDTNKSRDEMWKKIIGSCSTVWIVAEMNHAGSNKDAKKILKRTLGLMGNGGECQRVHIICTKSDDYDSPDDSDESAESSHDFEKSRKDFKDEVRNEFWKVKGIEEHFDKKSLKVFTVSSKRFLRGGDINPRENEIPQLKDCLKTLNDSHSVASTYVRGAIGILSLIQGSRGGAGQTKKELVEVLKKNTNDQLDGVKSAIEAARTTFEKCLDEGVEKSKRSCEEKLKKFLYPEEGGSGFHQTLKSVGLKGGHHITTKREEINVNKMLSSSLTESIDKEFRKTFPNENKRKAFSGVIGKLSFGTEELMNKYRNVELQLKFLQSQEDIIKESLIKIIWERKKTMYQSLSETIQKIMQESYKKVGHTKGKGTLKKMRKILENAVGDLKNSMFDEAKCGMLKQLDELQEEVMENMKKAMMESVEYSLKDDDSIPDVSDELEEVEQCYDELKNNKELPETG